MEGASNSLLVAALLSFPLRRRKHYNKKVLAALRIGPVLIMKELKNYKCTSSFILLLGAVKSLKI